MKKVGLFVLACAVAGFVFSAIAADTPPDPKFKGSNVKWYSCKTGRKDIQEGMNTRESKIVCLETKQVGTGSELEMKLKEGDMLYAIVPSSLKDASKGFELQCDTDSKKTGLSGGARGGAVDTYFLSAAELSQTDGTNQVRDDLEKKGQYYNQMLSFEVDNCRDAKFHCKYSDQNCQFYNKSTNTRIGLFHISIDTCKGKGPSGDGASSGGSDIKKKLKLPFGG